MRAWILISRLAGKIFGTQKKIMRMKITVLAFAIPLQRKFFAMPSAGQISWPSDQLLPSFPAAAKTLDHFYLRGEPTSELYLFSSLKGLVNRKSPRLFSYEGDAFAEGPFTWLESLGLTWVEYGDKW